MSAETPGETIGRIVGELQGARAEIVRLNAVVSDQAKTLATLTDDDSPASPSLAIVYWLWSLKRGGEKSWRCIWNRITPLISDLGSLPAQRLTSTLWDQHRARRRSQMTARGTPPCEWTLNIELSRAKEMLNWAVAGGLIKFNRLAAATAMPAVSQRETKLPSIDIDLLLHVSDEVTDGRLIEGDDDGQKAAVLQAFILACFDSMLRFNEARHLRRDRIGADGVVELLASETKSKRQRVVVLTPRTLEAIKRVWSVPGNPHVFVNTRTGELIGENNIRCWFRRACTIAGVDVKAAPGDRRIRIHDLRASGATVADMQGARASAIKTALGHSKMATTEKYLRSEATDNAHEIASVMNEASASRHRPGRKRPKPRRHRPFAAMAVA
jgi:integrase